ncbi:MAG: hypothetical protein A2896_03045 [Candidatus Nealsonbacteria bacterium RIFCSPLOWO2_01_FULL_43_32]|uniref:Uncharacterized protein n=1 Tax=Candidatus Nealsonbacteria bacterium RIFCSPLOWO2_01_FULL_43_32 TaxID=1801672 RepID=A0A1G2EDK7_9BACT|nr:MAG: hypothetical protein A2896_03045 [Candidatus Nealsonbacteria bacterium RIFCSPLOWO2_01_FULL_43_32]
MKKIIISLMVALALFLALAVGVFLILKFGEKQPVQAPKEEQTLEEKIKSATAPARTGPLSTEEGQRIEKLLKSVTAP